jgi:pre-rRNA-processing protein TSR2
VLIQVDAQQAFDHAIYYTLSLWPALNFALTQALVSDASAAKDLSPSERLSLFAGGLSDVFLTHPNTDQEDLEEVILQVLEDEFEVLLDDGSERAVASRILEVRAQIGRGDWSGVERLENAWKEQVRLGKGVGSGKPIRVIEEEDADEDDEEDSEEENDVEMADGDEVPTLVESHKNVEVEVDEDGFTKVPSRRRR